MVKLITPTISTVSGRVHNKVLKANRIHVKPTRSLNKVKTITEESWLAKHFKEFASNTALHGYIHIVREDSTKCER